jgi:hypothetical protein
MFGVDTREVEMITKRILLLECRPLATSSVAYTLEKGVNTTIQSWFELVERNEELSSVYLSFHDRVCHLSQLFRDVIYRLRAPAGTTDPFSIAAREHGAMRRRQGYNAGMVVEESRILEVSIFTTIQNNLRSLDLGRVLLDVVTIADECDSQLKQAILSYEAPGSKWAA